MSNELITELVEAGVHFGHQSRKWNPKMRQFLLGEKHNVHLINLEKTAEQLDASGKFLADLASSGKKILFVGCKRQAQEAVREAAEATGQFYVNHRWLGGTLTNLETVRKSVGRMEYLENLQKSPDFKKMSKKERPPPRSKMPQPLASSEGAATAGRPAGSKKHAWGHAKREGAPLGGLQCIVLLTNPNQHWNV